MPIGRGKVSLQRKAARRNGWTVARRAIFLEALGRTCNVTTAAREAGLQAKSARALKKRDGEFARLWFEAFEEGKERLREEALASQLSLVPSGDNPTEDDMAAARAAGEQTPPAAFDALTAIKVLQALEGLGDRRVKNARTATQAEVDAMLIARLEALALQRARKAARATGNGAGGAGGADAGGAGGGGGGLEP